MSDENLSRVSLVLVCSVILGFALILSAGFRGTVADLIVVAVFLLAAEADIDEIRRMLRLPGVVRDVEGLDP